MPRCICIQLSDIFSDFMFAYGDDMNIMLGKWNEFIQFISKAQAY